MALLKFFEGKEGSYSSSSHSGGLYFAKDTGVILFKGIRYGGQPDLSGYANKSDISSLQGQISKKANIDHTHKIEDISDLILANSDHDGLMPSSMYEKLNGLEMINRVELSYTTSSDYVDIRGALSSEESGNLPNSRSSLRLTAATSSMAGVMSSSDKEKLDNLVGDESIVKKVFSNFSTSENVPNNTLNHDIEVRNNMLGFVFSPPLVVMSKQCYDPTDDTKYIQAIRVFMTKATSSRDGYMTATQASQLSDLYSRYGSKRYLSFSEGGTVTGSVAFDGGFRINHSPLELMGEGLEIYHKTPFIDFHYNKSSEDYTSRIIETSSGVLNINEVLLSNGQVTATKVNQTSDIRLKENISTIVEDTDKIKDVKFFEFNHISDKNKTKSYGVIAQDLEEVGLKNLVIEDADGYKSVDYNALLILEIQRLRNEIDILKSKIS